MADNTLIAPASLSVNVATDDVGGVHYQRVKLASGDADSAEMVGDTDKGASRALWVDPRPSSASQAQNSAGLTIASTAYVSGDTLGTGWTFTAMARETGGGGRITGAALLDKADVITSVDLVLSSAAITFGTDNLAPAPSDTDAEKLLNTISLVALDYGSARLATIGNVLVPYVCDATSLFVYAITRAAHTFFGAVTDLRLRLFYDLD
jgi:hypothetical protein